MALAGRWEAVELPAGKVAIELRDLTGFNGRCDAILPDDGEDETLRARIPELRAFRRKLTALLGRAGRPREV